eukprot:TRINITY_DN12977_c0_g1_i1.p1 TRINITY_DN12977_c0_g1~~TRINITY_DN12977_c0_g1_i1.p1  ORF type:complete len:421 (+),score=52.70 TRINITY_DN12977_c0_g1_i1:62-1324(+)
MTEEDKNIAQFNEWMVQNGFNTNRSKIGISTFDETGRGAIAIKDIKTNDLVVEVPKKIIVSRLAAEISDISNVIVDPRVEHDNFLALSLFLMYESENRSSFWLPFLKMLPKNFNCPIFWTLDELKHVKGSYIYKSTSKKRLNCTRSYFEFIVPLIKSYPQFFNSINATYDKFMWATFLIFSRGYWLDNDDTLPGLVPLADMINHSVPPNQANYASYKFHESTQTFCIHSNFPFKTGEQVFITYGAKSNYELLIDYGFLMEPAVIEELFVPFPNEKWKNTLEMYEQKIGLFDHFKIDKSVLHYMSNKPIEDFFVPLKIWALSKTDLENNRWTLESLKEFQVSEEIYEKAKALMEDICDEYFEGCKSCGTLTENEEDFKRLSVNLQLARLFVQQETSLLRKLQISMFSEQVFANATDHSNGA